MARRFSFFIVMLLAWRPGAAETVSETVYLAGFAAQDPGFAALDGPLATARGEERSARTLLNPVVDFEREAPGDAVQSTFALSWSPPIDGRRGPAEEASRAAVEAAQGTLDWSRLRLRVELREAYADWALAAARTDVVRSQVAAFRSVVAKAAERQRVGEESGLTTQRLSLALVEFEANAARSNAELVHRRALALGLTTASFEDPVPTLPALPEPQTNISVDVHPLLRARAADVKEAEARVRSSGRFFLSPELRAGWQTLRDGAQDSDGLVVGGSLSLPLFDRRQGERVAWEGRLRAASGQLAWEERRARAMLGGAEASYRRLREAALSTETALQGTDRMMEQARARFQLGESDVTDLLDVMRSVLSSRLAGLELYQAALEAHRQLELASGKGLIETQGGGR